MSLDNILHEAKRVMERRIEEAVLEFEVQTGLFVSDVEVHHTEVTQVSDTRRSYRVDVRAEAKL